MSKPRIERDVPNMRPGFWLRLVMLYWIMRHFGTASLLSRGKDTCTPQDSEQ